MLAAFVALSLPQQKPPGRGIIFSRGADGEEDTFFFFPLQNETSGLSMHCSIPAPLTGGRKARWSRVTVASLPCLSLCLVAGGRPTAPNAELQPRAEPRSISPPVWSPASSLLAQRTLF